MTITDVREEELVEENQSKPQHESNLIQGKVYDIRLLGSTDYFRCVFDKCMDNIMFRVLIPLRDEKTGQPLGITSIMINSSTVTGIESVSNVSEFIELYRTNKYIDFNRIEKVNKWN